MRAGCKFGADTTLYRPHAEATDDNQDLYHLALHSLRKATVLNPQNEAAAQELEQLEAFVEQEFPNRSDEL